MHDTFRRNATFLIASQAITAGSTFLFWLLCARLFTPATVGLATAFISFGVLAATFTHLGLPTTVARFMPTSRRPSGLLYAALLAVIGASIIVGTGALLLLGHVAPALAFVRSSAVLSGLLVTLITCTALLPLLDNATMAFRQGHYILLKSAALSVPRVVLPFVVAHTALTGIVGAYVLLLVAGVLGSFILVRTKLLRHRSGRPSYAELAIHVKFTAGNYLGNIAGILPSTLVPIIVLNQLGAAQAAYFYMPMQLAVFLGVIASSTAAALVSETAQHDDPEKHRVQALAAIAHLFRMRVPAAAFLAIAGWVVLRLYGQAYSTHGYAALVVLCIASIFVGVNWIGDTWLIITKRMTAYFGMNVVNAALVVVLATAGASHGLLGVSVGWLLGQSLTALLFGVLFGPRRAIYGYLRSSNRT
jgi:O-antigen/teichoic acid export membrane protein